MPKAEQTEIPGTEAPKIPAIEKAAAKFRDTRDDRMKLTEKEKTAKDALIAMCQEHQDEMSVNADGDRIYRMGDEVVIFTDRLNVKVRAAADDAGDED